MGRFPPFAFVIASLLFTARGASDDPRHTVEWAGTVDTLVSGQVIVTNPATPLWAPGSGWRVVEQARIGWAGG